MPKNFYLDDDLAGGVVELRSVGRICQTDDGRDRREVRGGRTVVHRGGRGRSSHQKLDHLKV